MEKRNRNHENLLLCMLEGLVGILLLINPIGFTSGILIGTGIVLAVLGAVQLIGYFQKEPAEAAQSEGFAKGLLLILGGWFCVFRYRWFLAAFPLLTVLYGAATLLGGIHKIQWGMDLWRTHQKYWYVAMIGAGCALLFSVLILVNPFATTAFLWIFIGVSLIVEAAVDTAALILEKNPGKEAS